MILIFLPNFAGFLCDFRFCHRGILPISCQIRSLRLEVSGVHPYVMRLKTVGLQSFSLKYQQLFHSFSKLSSNLQWLKQQFHLIILLNSCAYLLKKCSCCYAQLTQNNPRNKCHFLGSSENLSKVNLGSLACKLATGVDSTFVVTEVQQMIYSYRVRFCSFFLCFYGNINLRNNSIYIFTKFTRCVYFFVYLISPDLVKYSFIKVHYSVLLLVKGKLPSSQFLCV